MWHGIYGHDAVVERFRRTLETGRLASTYLFVGPEGVGKRRFASELARSLLCTQSADAALEACGECVSCRLFSGGNHPDLELVGLPKDKTKLPIELFVGDREHRHQEGLCHRIALKPFLADRRIAIIDDADHFNQESANCLLKTLEEPPPRSLLILIGTSPSRQLPTIRSRAQVVRFSPLDPQTVARILTETGLVSDSKQAATAAELSGGSVSRALELADPALWQFREQLFRELEKPQPVRLTRAVQAFVDDAGKETAEKRARLRLVLGFAIAFYRDRLAVEAASGGTGPSVNALDACLATLDYVDRNVNLATAIQEWSDTVTRGIAGESLVSSV
jgi:DNA polymerase-3 subunit delta'